MRNGKRAIQNVLDALQMMGIPWAYMKFRSKLYVAEPIEITNENHEAIEVVVNDELQPLMAKEQECEVRPPFAVYYGSGQTMRAADDTHYWSEDTYTIEYYFTEKSSTNEEGIEAAILAEGFQFEKSEDVYLEDEDVFAIYYYLN